jgi:Cdc6-like AAA superfamily ATPase
MVCPFDWILGEEIAKPSVYSVVLMDELDQMVTTKQDVVYNFFDWPTQPGSKLVVVAVANTMDLPERTLTGKVRSRMGTPPCLKTEYYPNVRAGEERVIFSPYNVDQLRAIVNSRLEMATTGFGKPEDVMVPDAITLAAKRVAAISGDARRMLDICRYVTSLHSRDKGPHHSILGAHSRLHTTSQSLVPLDQKRPIRSIVKCRTARQRLTFGDAVCMRR